MSNLRLSIESLMQRFEPPRADLEGIVRRQRVAARRRRVGTVFIASVVAAAGISLAVVALQGSSTVRTPLASSPPLERAKIAFIKKTEAPLEGLFVALTDGSELRRLSPPNLGASGPAWSPDGSRVAFAGVSLDAPGKGAAIFLVNGDGSHLERITDYAENREPAWSPDGRMIAFSGARSRVLSVFVVNVDGTGLRGLTDGHIDTHPSWSPDGTAILFSREEGPGPGMVGWRLYSIGTSGGDLTPLGFGLGASWSPDGKSVIFLAGQGGLFVMRSDGTDVRQLRDCGQECLGYAGANWSPDGRFIIAWDQGSVVEGGSDIYVLSSDGSQLRRLFAGPSYDCCASLQPEASAGAPTAGA
jgi:Tol biopolymer transport system component